MTHYHMLHLLTGPARYVHLVGTDPLDVLVPNTASYDHLVDGWEQFQYSWVLTMTPREKSTASFGSRRLIQEMTFSDFTITLCTVKNIPPRKLLPQVCWICYHFEHGIFISCHRICCVWNLYFVGLIFLSIRTVFKCSVKHKYSNWWFLIISMNSLWNLLIPVT